jgi:energy-coupling factor transport system substrate-specific component
MSKSYFSNREWLVIGVLAVVGGMSSVALGKGGPYLCSRVAIPGGLQAFAGVHVLPLVIVAGLIRRPGAATVAGLLKGGVELLAGSGHGLVVLGFAGLAGLVVDAVFLLARRRGGVMRTLVAGGLGSASNVVVLGLAAGLPYACKPALALPWLVGISFGSGVVFAGGLGWAILEGLRRAGLKIARRADTGMPSL